MAVGDTSVAAMQAGYNIGNDQFHQDINSRAQLQMIQQAQQQKQFQQQQQMQMMQMAQQKQQFQQTRQMEQQQNNIDTQLKVQSTLQRYETPEAYKAGVIGLLQAGAISPVQAQNYLAAVPNFAQKQAIEVAEAAGAVPYVPSPNLPPGYSPTANAAPGRAPFMVGNQLMQYLPQKPLPSGSGQQYRRVIPDAQGNLVEIVSLPDGSTRAVPVTGTNPGEFAKPPPREPAATQKANQAFQGASTEVDNALKATPIKVQHWYGGSTVYDDTGLELAIDRAFSANKDMGNTVKQELVKAQDPAIRQSVLGNIKKAIQAEQFGQTSDQPTNSTGNANYTDWK